jgi:uroporphyrinogen-III synthase
VNSLINKILNDEIRVIAFTSAPQVRMLFDFARQLGRSDAVTAKLKSNVVIASVGEVTSRALEEHGLVAQIVPKQPKMGALAQAVAEHIEKLGA